MPTGAKRTRDAEGEATARAERHLAAGETALALAALTPVLAARADAGDRVVAAALLLLQGAEVVAPDAVAGAVDRLLGVVARQDRQIRALMALLEARL